MTQQLRPYCLERDIVVCNRTGVRSFRFRHTLIEAAGRGATGTSTIVASSFAAATEQDQVIHHDFGHIALLICVLVVPGASLKASFNVDLAAFLEVFTGYFSQSSPGYDVVPLGLVLPLLVFIFVTIAGGNRESRHRGAAGRVFQFRVLAEVSDEDNFVDTFHGCSLVSLSERPGAPREPTARNDGLWAGRPIYQNQRSAFSVRHQPRGDWFGQELKATSRARRPHTNHHNHS